MLIPALRDLQWRRRRFTIAILATALVFGMTLALTGLRRGFDVEASRTVKSMHVDGWVVREGAAGPFLGAAPIPANAAGQLAKLPGVRRVGATVFTRKTVGLGDHPKDVNVFGAPTGGPGMPEATTGRSPEKKGEIAVSTALDGYHIGSPLVVAGRTFTVVGKVARSTGLAGVANVFLTLPDAQLLAYAGQPVAAAFAFEGAPTGKLPPDLKVVGQAVGRDDLIRAVESAKSTVGLISVLLWLVAAAIVGSVIYLSALERTRDFAVFKATGVPSREIAAGVALQAVIVAVAAAVIGIGIAAVLGPNLGLPVVIDARAQLLLPAIAVLVGLAASLAGLRRVASVEPALAFGGP